MINLGLQTLIFKLQFVFADVQYEIAAHVSKRCVVPVVTLL